MIEPKKAVLGISAYALADRSRKGKIRLDLNENNWGCSPKVIEALRNVRAADISVYPEYGALTAKLSEFLGVEPDTIMTANGSDGAIETIAETYVDRGDEVIIPVPTFSIFEHCCRLRDADIRKVAYTGDLSFPLRKVLDAITGRTRMIVVVNPNSPTGTSIGEDDLAALLKAAPDSVVVLDEAYTRYTGKSHAGLTSQFPNLVALGTFSKAYGLAGLRIGYVISRRENIESMKKVSLPFSVNAMAAAAVIAAIDDQEHVDGMIGAMKEEKKYLAGELEALGIRTRDTEINFILADIGRRSGAVFQKLRSRGILVRMLKEPPLDGHFRITLAGRDENARFVEAMKDIVPPEAVIFDIDGVLVDDSKSYRLAIRKTAQHFLGRELSPAVVQEYKNRGGYNDDWDLTAAIVKAEGKDAGREKIIEKFQEYYLGEDFNGLIQNETWLLDEGVLDRLGRDFRLGVVTGRPRKEAEHVLRRFKADRYFDVIVAMEDTPSGKGKPDPLGITMAMEKLGVKRAVYVGDTIDDVKAAKAAGIAAMGVAGASGAPEEQKKLLEREGARWVVGSANEILEVLEIES
ncbi:MAG: histidinol-phosphate transaminase [Pseudomonadota bacterium]